MSLNTNPGSERLQGMFDFCKKGDSLYKMKDYKNSPFTYSKAFKSIGWKGSQTDRYNAACSYALAGVADSATDLW